jgi:uncharacterized membrane protein YqjE
MSLDPTSGASNQARAARGERVSFSSWLSSVGELAQSFLRLFLVEAKQAGISLAFMLAFGVAAAVLLITGWLALIACVVAALVLYTVLGWIPILIIAAVLSFAGAGVFGYLIIKRAKDLLFKATRRQLSIATPATERSNAKPG